MRKRRRNHAHDNDNRVVVTDRKSTMDENILRHLDDWIESYKLGKDSALIALLNFFVHAMVVR